MDETTKDNTEECVNGIKEEQHEAIILPPALTKIKMDKTTKDNTEECVIKEEQDEAIILPPALTKIKMDKTTEFGIKEEQDKHDEAITLRPALKKKKWDETEECVNGNMEEPDEDAEVIGLEEWSDESAASSVDSTEEEMFLDGLDPLLDR